MYRLGFVSIALVLVADGCGTANRALDAPAPGVVRLQSGAPPRSVIRAAAERLVESGFLVTAIDSSSRLRAEREQRPGELGNTVACRTASTPRGRASVTPTLIIDLAAEPRRDGGSELVLASRVHAFYLRLSADPGRPSSDSDCRSTGFVERRLAEFLIGAAQ
jgi:hypothetical protein